MKKLINSFLLLIFISIISTYAQFGDTKTSPYPDRLRPVNITGLPCFSYQIRVHTVDNKPYICVAGTWTVIGGSSITLNPTTGRIPYLSGANTFSDSSLSVSGTTVTANNLFCFAQACLKTGSTGAIAVRNTADTGFGILVSDRFRAVDASENIKIGIAQSASYSIDLTSAGAILFSTSAVQSNGAKDLGLWREAAGIFAIYDGATPGNYRDAKARHYLSGGSIPTCGSISTAIAGTGATCVLTANSTDSVGEITLTTGTGTSTNTGVIFVITYATTYPTFSKCTFAAANEEAAGKSGGTHIESTASTFSFIDSSFNYIDGTVYKWTYNCGGK